MLEKHQKCSQSASNFNRNDNKFASINLSLFGIIFRVAKREWRKPPCVTQTALCDTNNNVTTNYMRPPQLSLIPFLLREPPMLAMLLFLNDTSFSIKKGIIFFYTKQSPSYPKHFVTHQKI